MNGPAPLLETVGLDVAVGGRRLVSGLDWTIRPGECWALLGLNGAGKTSLLHTLGGLRPPAAGEIRLDGTALSALGRRRIARRLGVLFQDYQDLFPGTVLETAMTGRLPHLAPWRWESAADRERVQRALAEVDLEGFADRAVNTLSGGERRRLALATVLAQAPAVYLLDEPINHLDLHHQITMLETVRRRIAEGAAAVLVLHDLNLAARFCDRACLLLQGSAGETRLGSLDALFRPETLSRLYGHSIRVFESPEGPLYHPA